MIADQFLENISALSKAEATASDILNLNKLSLQLDEKAVEEEESELHKTLNEISLKIIPRLLKNSFAWSAEVGIKLAEFFEKFDTVGSVHFYELGDISYMHKAFPIQYFRIIADSNVGRIGGSESYDYALRGLSKMMKFFYHGYLQKILAFKPFLESKSLHLFDPFFRHSIRSKNQQDQEILNVFFTQEFDLKEFVLIGLKKFFPNVSWRWLGSGHYAHLFTLKIVLLIFEYGLWKMEELDRVMTKVYSISEILSNLEDYIVKDSFSGSFSEESLRDWKTICERCRKITGEIFLHIIMMYLDQEVLAALPQFKLPINSHFSKEPRIKNSSPYILDVLFYHKRFKKKKLYTYFAYSLITYLIKPTVIGVINEKIESKSLSKICETLLAYVSDINNDFFYVSLNTLQPETLSFYHLAPESSINISPFPFIRDLQNIIDKIRLCGYEDMESDYSVFLNECRQCFSRLVAFLLPKEKSFGRNVYVAYQLAFSSCNILQYILLLLDFISKLPNTLPNKKKTIEIGVRSLVLICRDNKQSINLMFTDINFKHVKNFFKQDLLGATILIGELFKSASSIMILERNHEIFEEYIGVFSRTLENILGYFYDYLTKKEFYFSHEDVSSMLFLCRLFRMTLKNSESSNFKFELLITEKLTNPVIEILQFFSKKIIDMEKANTALTNSFGKPGVFMKRKYKIENLETYEMECIICEIAYYIMSLFEVATRRIYFSKTFSSMQTDFKSNIRMEKFVYLCQTDLGLKVLKMTLRIFSNFMIFHQNHLMKPMDNDEVVLGRLVQTDYLNSEQMGPFVYAQLLCFSAPLKSRIEREGISSHMSSFLFGAYFVSIFKLFSGFLTLLTDRRLKDLEKSHRTQFILFIAKFKTLVDLIESKLGKKESNRPFIQNFLSLYKAKNPLYLTPRTLNPEADTTRENGYALLAAIVSLFAHQENKADHLLTGIRFNHMEFETSTIDIARSRLEFNLKFRQEYCLSKKRAVVWTKSLKSVSAVQNMGDVLGPKNHFEKQRMIKGLDFEFFDSEDIRAINTSGERTSSEGANLLLQTEQFNHTSGNLVEEPTSSLHTTAENIIIFLQERYKFMKSYFIEHPNANQILVVFKLEDILKKNIQIFIKYFCDKVKTLDLSCNTLENNFFTDSSFFSLFLLMDNLIRISPSYRDNLYQILNPPKTTEVASENLLESQELITTRTPEQESIFYIWRLHYGLLNFVLFKTCLDDTWKEVYSSYYLVSNLIQNFCEDNNVLFKTWFQETKPIADTKEKSQPSFLEIYYSYLEVALQSSDVCVFSRTNLTLTDRPELFFVYNRMVEGMTEFINGGKMIDNSLIYSRRIDIWVGIIMRVVDDVDSSFYELKFKVLLYIIGIMEGFEPTTVEFIASNFSVTKIFQLLLRLVKKLYIRQRSLKRFRGRAGREFLKSNSVNCVTEEDEKLLNFSSTTDLLDFYKKYPETFSDHVIMNTVVMLYTFMRDMSKVVVRYKNFLAELNEIRHQFFGSQRKFENIKYDADSLTIWNFISHIIIDVEIAYKGRNWQDGDLLDLKLHYFKKLPMCFFLTQSAKQKFRDSVSIDSLQIKHDEFFEKTKQHTIAMRDLQRLFKRSKFFFYTSTEFAFKIYQRTLYLIAIVINILFLIFYRGRSRNDFTNDSGVNGLPPVITLAIVDASLAFVFLMYWFVVKYRSIYKIKWDEYFLLNNYSKSPPLLTKLYINVWRCLFGEGAFRTFIFHILFCLLGMLVTPFFYSILLLLVIDLSFLVYSVAMSFVTNYEKLAITLVMIGIIINFFAYIAADFFSKYFQDDDKKDMCKTYFSCFMNSMNSGLRAGGGMADIMAFNSNNSSSDFAGRFLFDVFFFILVNIILLGIFFGIIVDSFKEYRNIITSRQKDEENICFTCGLNRDMLEKAGVQFSEHQRYHDIWNYLYYACYLKWKPVSMYDGVDLYVSDILKSGNKSSWLPIGRTLALQAKNINLAIDEDGEEIKTRLKSTRSVKRDFKDI